MKVLIVLFVVTYVSGQGMPKKPAVLPMTEDVPHIVCDVCQKAARTLYKNVRAKREENAPVKLSEEDALNIVEKTCDPENDYGEWITKLDVTEEKDKLKLVEHTKPGRCLEECKTVQRACEEAIGDVDTDIGEVLWKDEMKLSTFINEVCFKISRKCGTKHPKKYKSGKRKDHKFIEMSDKEREAQKMMANMKGMPGMPGMEMYSREDIAAMQEQMGGGEQLSGGPSAEDDQGDQMHSQNVNFFDFLKQLAGDIANKLKEWYRAGYKATVSMVDWLLGNTGKRKKREL